MFSHTNHFSPASPRIRILVNHLKFYNPGGLSKPLGELKGKDFSVPRSPIITKLFKMAGFAENVGFGFVEIVDNWKEYCDLKTVYKTKVLRLRCCHWYLPDAYSALFLIHESFLNDVLTFFNFRFCQLIKLFDDS